VVPSCFEYERGTVKPSLIRSATRLTMSAETPFGAIDDLNENPGYLAGSSGWHEADTALTGLLWELFRHENYGHSAESVRLSCPRHG
jgi:hypothetical protein